MIIMNSITITITVIAIMSDFQELLESELADLRAEAATKATRQMAELGAIIIISSSSSSSSSGITIIDNSIMFNMFIFIAINVRRASAGRRRAGGRRHPRRGPAPRVVAGDDTMI